MIRIQLPDGSVADFDTDDPQRAASAARRVMAMKAADTNRGGSNFVEDFARQVPRSLGVSDEVAAASGFVGQGVKNLLDQARGRPIEMSAGDAALGSAAFDRMEGDRIASAKPVTNTLAGVAGFAVAGKPGVTPGPLAAARGVTLPPQNPLVAGLKTAGVVAPFAVAQQDGDLLTRTKDAAPAVALGGVLGAGAQALGNQLGRWAARSPAARIALEFEQAGIRPTMAALLAGETSGAPSITKAIAENYWAGGNARRNLQASISDTGNAVNDMAQRVGSPTSPMVAGENIQAGVQRWAAPAREGGVFKTRAAVLYDNALRPFEARRASASSAEAELGSILGDISGPASREVMVPEQLKRIAGAITSDRGKLTVKDLRRWREWVRRAQTDDALSQTIDNASLQRLEGALTRDIYEAMDAYGGAKAVAQLRRADQYYAAGQSRIANALDQFNGKNKSGENVYQRVLTMAQDKGGVSRPQAGNVRALVSLKRSVQPEDWNSLRATVISRMGRPRASAPDALDANAFSVEGFVTNYASMSPEGRRILFGSMGGGGQQADQLMTEMERLARVASQQKRVEAAANRSRSGVSMGNIAVSPFNPAAWPLLAGMSITGEAMTNPAFVRWLANAPNATGAPGGMAAHLQRLGQLAANDPALLPVYDDLARQLVSPLAPQSPGPEGQPLSRAQSR